MLVSFQLAGCLSTVDGAPQQQLPNDIEQAQAAQLCSGQTPIGKTAWTSDREDVVQVDVDTSACNLSGNPLYFTSIGGKGHHWVTRGVTSIQRATKQGFRVLVLHPKAEQVAEPKHWHVNWLARPEGLTSNKLCTGRTAPSRTRQDQGSVAFRVDLEHCGFNEPPVLLTSLGGEQGHALTRGANSVYGTNERRFTVFIQKSDVTVEQALAWGWHLNWVAMPESNDNGGFCTGKTAPKNTDWQQFSRNGLTTRLATDCQAPLVFATLSGRHSHWYTRGASSIYGVDGPNFRLRVNRYAATPEFARDNNWHIHWTRATPTLR